MNVTFLYAADGTPLCKTLIKTESGIEKKPYPHVLKFNSGHEQINTLEEFNSALIKYSQFNACLLKGNTQYQLKNSSRAGSTDSTAPTEFLVLDIDNLPIEKYNLKKLPNVIDAVIMELPKEFHDVSYIIQYSASTGIDTSSLSAHIFFMLDVEIPAMLLKIFMRQMNLQIPFFNERLSLSRTNTVLKYPLDVTINQNDKLIYIAPPELIGLRNPFPRSKPSIFIIKKSREELRSANLLNDLSPLPTIDKLSAIRVTELREAKGLDKIAPKMKLVSNIEIMANPDASIVTGAKTNKEFTYLNLNGGDSWAYYHPTNNAEILFNFKGEPNYLLKKIAPDYYAQACKEAEKQKVIDKMPQDPGKEGLTGRAYLAFRDFTTDMYYNGWFDYDSEQLTLVQTTSRSKLVDFMKQHGQPEPDFIPDFSYSFQPGNLVMFNPEDRFINKYQVTTYMRTAIQGKRKGLDPIPTTIRKVIHHALGGDDECFDRFINWLAVIVQHRCKTKTAWLLHGTQGTGKGVMFNNIITPIIGSSHSFCRTMSAFEDQFNGWMEQALVIMIDEVQVSKSKQAALLMQKIKNMIPDPTVTIRRMHSTGSETQSYSNLIFASNMPDPVQIDPADRRMNCGVYQKTPIKLTSKDIEAIKNELMAFTEYLMDYKASKELAATPLKNKTHEDLQYLTRNSIDLVSDALNTGDLDFFLEQMPTGDVMKGMDGSASLKYQAYLDVFKRALPMEITNNKSVIHNIPRDDIRTLFQYTVGNMPETAHKFTSLIKHHNIRIHPIAIDGKTTRGFTVVWNITDEVIRQWHQEVGTPIKTTKTRTKKVTPIKRKQKQN